MISILSKFSTAPLEKELICEIVSEGEKTTLGCDVISNHSDANNQCETNKHARDVIIINVSPIEFGHSLLIPSLEETLPQILTESSIRYRFHQPRLMLTVIKDRSFESSKILYFFLKLSSFLAQSSIKYLVKQVSPSSDVIKWAEELQDGFQQFVRLRKCKPSSLASLLSSGSNAVLILTKTIHSRLKNVAVSAFWS